MIATALTVPIVVVLALLLGRVNHPLTGAPSSHPASGPVTVAAPPANPGASRPCAALLGTLPITLAGRPGRPARSSWTYVAAWGDPAVVLRCGVPRPPDLQPGSSAFVATVNGVAFLHTGRGTASVFTAVDRAVYVEVAVPGSEPQPPLGPIAVAIAASLPAVCVVDPHETDPTRLCTHRP